MGGFDGPRLLASDDASSSTVEWRSSLLISGRGDGDGEAVSIAVGEACCTAAVTLVSTVNDLTPFLFPTSQLIQKSIQPSDFS